jgi:hypothetical protein
LSENLPHFLRGVGEQRREAIGTREEDMRKVFFSFPFIPFFFLLPSSFFLLPSSFFLLPSSLFRQMDDGRTNGEERIGQV